MGKVKKVLMIIAKLIQVLGIGLGTAAMTDPSSLSGLIPSEYITILAGASAIVNAFLPSVLKKSGAKNLGS